MLKNYLVLPLLVLSFVVVASPRESIPLEQCIAAGTVSVQFTGKGGYQRECMEMVIQNLSADSVVGFVEPGRRLNSVDDSEQDILVVKAAQFRLRKFERDTILITGFCCESTKSAPSKGSFFAVGTLAPAAWLILANLINLHPFDHHAIQHAIWVLSNDHDIRSIPAYKNPIMDQLRHTVADILDIELPWYSFRYLQTENELFSGTKTHFFAEVEFSIPERAMITPEICRPNGELVFRGEPVYFSAGEHTISVDAPIKGWAETEYDLYLMEDFHTQNKKLRFTLADQPQAEEE